MRIILLFLFALVFPLALATAQPKADGICLAKKCGATLLRCGFESACRDWLQCVLGCGEDKVRCPSICGFSYQSSPINATNQCIFSSQCVELGFDELAAYEPNKTLAPKLEEFEGTYWFAASYGGGQIFDLDCQRFDVRADPESAERVLVKFSVPLAQHGQPEVVKTAEGSFRKQPDGALEVAYDNFVGYHEHWYILAQSADDLLAHVCIQTETRCAEYGTVLLSRQPLSAWTPERVQELDARLQAQAGIGFWDMKMSRTHSCPNGQL